MTEIILAVALFIVYLGLRERFISHNMWMWWDAFMIALLTFRFIRYDEQVSLYLLSAITGSLLGRMRRRDTPTPAP